VLSDWMIGYANTFLPAIISQLSFPPFRINFDFRSDGKSTKIPNQTKASKQQAGGQHKQPKIKEENSTRGSSDEWYYLLFVGQLSQQPLVNKSSMSEEEEKKVSAEISCRARS
jgi:hypothetical protein